jgi:hypothetical protein
MRVPHRAWFCGESVRRRFAGRRLRVRAGLRPPHLMPDTLASAKSERERCVCRDHWSSSQTRAPSRAGDVPAFGDLRDSRWAGVRTCFQTVVLVNNHGIVAPASPPSHTCRHARRPSLQAHSLRPTRHVQCATSLYLGAVPRTTPAVADAIALTACGYSRRSRPSTNSTGRHAG